MARKRTDQASRSPARSAGNRTVRPASVDGAVPPATLAGSGAAGSAVRPRASRRVAGLAPRLSLISRVTDRLVRTVDFDEALQTLIEGATELLQVERGSIMILDHERQTLSIRVAKGLDETVVRSTRIHVGEGIAGSVAKTGVPLMVHDIRELPAWQQTTTPAQREEYHDHSALCVPLTIHGQVRGVMNFNHKRGRRSFDAGDLEFALLIANQAAVVLFCATLHQQFRKRQEMEVDLRIARGLQGRFLAHEPPDVPGFVFAAECAMCNDVGGDYFDFIPLDRDRLAIAIGDAAGHGLGAALLATDARAALRSCIKRGDDIEQCLFEVNNLIKADAGDEMFMTLLVGVLDARRRRFRFATAGHLMPLVVRGGRLLRLPLMGSNLPLGIRRDLKFVLEQPIDLKRGDMMVLFTDGIWEATDAGGRRFGTDVMPGLLETSRAAGPRETIDALLAGAAAHREAPEPEDDYTMVVARAV
jgi:sigma-B regulation protein RsbU (phosphoserine phosphatase)